MGRRRPSRFNGLLLVRKASGPTSHDVVDMARKALRERRIGHTGTLDPMAEGLLILCIGRATRLQQYLLGWEKTYHGIIELGTATTTYDREGEACEPSAEVPEIDRIRLDELESRFCGQFDQLPPPYSARKVGGKKLYELARSGQDTPLEPKRVRVSELDLRLADSRIELEVTSSSGFYVRSLAHDIGVELGCGGHLHHLDRVSIGPYQCAQAIAQSDLIAADDPQTVIDSGAWLPLDRVDLPFPGVEINSGALERFNHGQDLVIMHATESSFEPADMVAVRGPGGSFAGVGIIQHVLARGRTINVKPKMVVNGG